MLRSALAHEAQEESFLKRVHFAKGGRSAAARNEATWKIHPCCPVEHKLSSQADRAGEAVSTVDQRWVLLKSIDFNL